MQKTIGIIVLLTLCLFCLSVGPGYSADKPAAKLDQKDRTIIVLQYQGLQKDNQLMQAQFEKNQAKMQELAKIIKAWDTSGVKAPAKIGEGL